MRNWIRNVAVQRRTNIALALAGALIGVMKVSDLYAQSGCWNGGVTQCGGHNYCTYQAGSTCVVCRN